MNHNTSSAQSVSVSDVSMGSNFAGPPPGSALVSRPRLNDADGNFQDDQAMATQPTLQELIASFDAIVKQIEARGFLFQTHKRFTNKILLSLRMRIARGEE